MAELVLQGVSKTYPGQIVAVNGCDLAVADGECVVIVGPSGCGKTTLLRIISGLESPDRGTISLAGRIVNAVQPHRRDVAMIFQDFALYPHMRIRRNLAFALKLQRVEAAEIERRVTAAADMLGITDLLDRLPGELSGGERQRAALARVLVRQPACALFDEPLSNLDAGLRSQLRGELRALHQRHRITSVHVTHDQEEAMVLADRMVVMAEGAVQQIGTPADVYARPANRFVGGFIGSPTMNFIEGSIVLNDNGPCFTDRGGVEIALSEPCDRLAGTSVVLGIRPDCLSPSQPSDSGGCLHLKDITAQPMGPHVDVRGSLESGGFVTARLHQEPDGTDSLTLYCCSDDVHLFEPGEFGKRLHP